MLLEKRFSIVFSKDPIPVSHLFSAFNYITTIILKDQTLPVQHNRKAQYYSYQQLQAVCDPRCKPH
jgi:hypothetical protein